MMRSCYQCEKEFEDTEYIGLCSPKCRAEYAQEIDKKVKMADKRKLSIDDIRQGLLRMRGREVKEPGASQGVF